MVTRWYAGTLNLQDFWQQHSEHRIVTLKAALWAIGVLTSFNVVVATYVGFGMAVTTLVLIARMTHESLSAHRPLLPICLLPVSSLSCFRSSRKKTGSGPRRRCSCSS